MAAFNAWTTALSTRHSETLSRFLAINTLTSHTLKSFNMFLSRYHYHHSKSLLLQLPLFCSSWTVFSFMQTSSSFVSVLLPSKDECLYKSSWGGGLSTRPDWGTVVVSQHVTTAPVLRPPHKIHEWNWLLRPDLMLSIACCPVSWELCLLGPAKAHSLLY